MTGIVLACDGMSLDAVIGLGKCIKGTQYGPRLTRVKIHDLYDLIGPAVVKEISDEVHVPVWVDCKGHDTWQTVALRIAAIIASGAKFATVHASGEIDMMRAAVEAKALVANVETHATIIAVTALTSLDSTMVELTYGRSPLATALYFARLAMMAGIRRTVCSPLEVGYLKKRWELRDMLWVVPGTRSPGAAAGAQRRVAPPGQAVKDGADELVIGTEVTAADDPIAAFGHIVEQIEEAEATM